MKTFKGVIITVILIAVLAIAIFGRSAFSSALQDSKMFFAGISGGPVNQNEYARLVRENELLKFELQKQETKESNKEGRMARVYSRYPFNDKERMIIDLGESDGVDVGNPVLTKEGYLIGRISDIRGSQSEVQTVYDPEWKSSVAVGNSGNKAVIKGSQPPKLELLPKEAEVKKDDPIFNIDPGYPYQNLIGRIGSINDVPEEIWRRASVQIPYNINDIDKVIVLTSFP